MDVPGTCDSFLCMIENISWCGTPFSLQRMTGFILYPQFAVREYSRMVKCWVDWDIGDSVLSTPFLRLICLKKQHSYNDTITN